MTNKDKRELRQLCAEGYTFEEIQDIVSCAKSTIKGYMEIFSPEIKDEDKAIYTRKNKAPYPRTRWECSCGFDYVLNGGYTQNNELVLPTGKCMKCKKEIKANKEIKGE